MNLYDTTYATVLYPTSTGVVVRLDDTGEKATAYGSYPVRTRLIVSLAKKFPSGINRVRVESVLDYDRLGNAA